MSFQRFVTFNGNGSGTVTLPLLAGLVTVISTINTVYRSGNQEGLILITLALAEVMIY